MMSTSFDDEIYDVFLNVPSHGIHSPLNLHSFKGYNCIIPFKCSMCLGFVYPFTHAAECIRCLRCVHRTCVLSEAVICDRFLLGPQKPLKGRREAKRNIPSGAQWGVEGEISNDTEFHSPKEPKKMQVAHNSVTTVAMKLDVINGKIDFGKMPFTFPSPGSKDCIWRKSLRAIAAKFNLSRTASIPKNNKALEAYVLSTLTNNNGFAGNVCQILRSFYMEIQFDSDHNALEHARECLDTISCSVLTCLPMELGQDKDKLMILVNTVDRKVLSMNDSAMYYKVWSAAQRLENNSDNFLKLKLRSLRSSDPSFTSMVTDKALEKEVIYRLSQVGSSLTAIDKLCLLVEALKAVAMIASQSTSIPESSTPDPIGNRLVPSDDQEVGSVSRKESAMDALATQHLQDMNVDADLLLKRLVQMLMLYEGEEEDDVANPTAYPLVPETAKNKDYHELEEQTRETVYPPPASTPSATIQLDDSVVQQLRATRRRRLYWHAECCFIASLCRENDWLLGAEGYAMVTLQQALMSLCAQSDPEGERRMEPDGSTAVVGERREGGLGSDLTVEEVSDVVHLDTVDSAAVDNNVNNSTHSESETSSSKQTRKTRSPDTFNSRHKLMSPPLIQRRGKADTARKEEKIMISVPPNSE